MKKLFLIILLSVISSGCYSQLKVVHVNPPTPVHRPPVKVITSTGVSTTVNVDTFLILYNSNPSAYSEWKFFWRDRWVSPYYYYRYYHTPYRPIWVHHPYVVKKVETPPTVIIKSRKSTPRSSGVTNTNRNNNSNKNSRTQRQRSN